ncbi:MAG: helix-turn-helix transcriptional regulator [Clostridia bacterium]|nr:helix-turn-helix transcriptional regulator [Clostridia bacterium]
MYEIDREKFGAFVAARRKEKGYTQKELAEHLYISDKAVSKWETGVSIPDTALLVPLAELLGVSVTELLLSEKVTQDTSMKPGQIDDIIKTAILYTEDTPVRAYQVRSRWQIRYLLACMIGAAGLILLYLTKIPYESALISVLMSIFIGAYFCFFVKLRLPAYYDENRINGILDGIVRMHIPGLVFNNSNWKYIIRIGQIWACTVTAFFPFLTWGMYMLIPELWLGLEKYILLILCAGGLLIPVIVAGRKYE